MNPEVATPLLAGTFAIYEDGKGGYVLVTNTDEHGTQRKHIPGALVKMMNGNSLVGRLFGGA